MRPHQLSIRNILLLTVGTLTLLIALLVLGQIYTQWQRLARIESLREATLLSDRIFDAEEKLSEERDIAYSMLHASDGTIINSLRPQLEDSRKQVDEILRTTLPTLRKYDFPGIGNPLDITEKMLSDIEGLRRQIDKAVALPPEMRDHDLPQRWFGQATAMLLQTQDLWMQFITHYTGIDPIVTLHMRFKHFLGIIMEYSGRERALIGRLLVKNADPTPQEQAQLLQWQGAVDISWNISGTLADQGGLTPAITLYLKDAKSHYFTIYDMMRDIFYIPRAQHHGASYPITVDFWLELATQATDSLYTLKAAALKQTHNYMDSLEAKARREIIADLLLLLLAVVLSFYSFRTINRRVIFPIHSMINALISATEGKTVSLAPLFLNRQDEIGQLAHVLHVFQKNAEEVRNAQKASALLAAIVQSSDDAILSKTLDGIITSWNQGAVRLFGYSTSEAIGRHMSLIIPPERMEEEYYIVAQLNEGKPIEHFETLRRHKDGHDIDISLTVSPIHDASGNIIGASKILRDITTQKKAEQELRRYTMALERSNKELDDFAYIASHDLKEPLRGLFNNAKFLEQDYKDKLDADGVGRLARLGYLCQRMEQLVNDLLYFSRIGRQELAIAPTDLNMAIHDITSMMETTLTEKNATISIPVPLPEIVCDKTRVTEIFRNLITNAVKYNDQEKKVIEIGCLNEVQTKSGIEKQVFYVRDNGIGIEEEFYEEIFRIFKRLNEEDDDKKGTGVGLTFVRKIIDRHGGRIWLESSLGKGTTFYFTLTQGAPHANAA